MNPSYSKALDYKNLSKNFFPYVSTSMIYN